MDPKEAASVAYDEIHGKTIVNGSGVTEVLCLHYVLVTFLML